MFPTHTKILIVDDMKSMRMFLKNCLVEMHLEVIHEAADGAAAWAQIEGAITQNEPYELIITDWNMPRMRGIDLLRRIRSHPETSRVPVVILSAESTLEQVTEAIEAGATSYIVMPVTPELFREKITKVYEFSSRTQAKSAQARSTPTH